jgi:hypothetical protein
LHRNCLLKCIIEGKEEGTEDEADNVSSYWITKGNETILETEGGSIKLHSLENLFG